METIDQVSFKMIEAGKTPRIVSWGDYTKERSSLPGLKDRALDDFTYITGEMRSMLTSRTKMLEIQKMETTKNE